MSALSYLWSRLQFDNTYQLQHLWKYSLPCWAHVSISDLLPRYQGSIPGKFSNMRLAIEPTVCHPYSWSKRHVPLFEAKS
jgi:hypothetical protein